MSQYVRTHMCATGDMRFAERVQKKTGTKWDRDQAECANAAGEGQPPPERRLATASAKHAPTALQASGILAVRVPLSGATGGGFAGDIVLPLMGRDLCVEVPRADGFREFYSWLNERDVIARSRLP
jgi:hypothetical protein